MDEYTLDQGNGCFWRPTADIVSHSNIHSFMQKAGFSEVDSFHQWTTRCYSDFWSRVISQLGIVFIKKPDAIYNTKQPVDAPSWFPGARLNIVDSCFTAPPESIAIVENNLNGEINTITYRTLQNRVSQIAASFINAGFNSGDHIAIIMPMNHLAVAIYLGIIKMGGVVISIADSFSSKEIATRLSISKAKAVITQDVLTRGNKQYQLYQRVVDANAPTTIVIAESENLMCPTRDNDIKWNDFLSSSSSVSSTPMHPMSPCNILFSSGTTGIPKAILWNHSTAIRPASDGFFHQDIKPEDRVCWPTNLGWMMGPWLVFASLINHACIALYSQTPNTREFGTFIQNAKVTILGVVPTLVASWRESACMEDRDWSSIKLFTSTGECSNAEDMSYLMSLANNKPVIEYCGGTEIGGAYISSTIIQNNYPSQFTTATMGTDFIILNDNGKIDSKGEVAIIPPSLGLSSELLNANHYDIYFANMPKGPNGEILRRHGDQIQRLENGNYIILGRIDDTMNISGIKVSAVEIERALAGIPHLIESAAIAVPPENGGPNQLVVFVVISEVSDRQAVHDLIQKNISKQVNPLFKVSHVVFRKQLPKTASNKIMRRVLRDEYLKNET